MSGFPALSLKEIRIAYGKRRVVDGLDLDVAEGETFGLIGLNGVGKTSLIKAVLGLRDPAGGDIRIFGRDVSDMGSRKRIAYLPERFDPPWFLSGMEFLDFSTRFYDISLDTGKARSLAEDLMLDPDVLKNRVQTYSKGMRQKLGLMATLLTMASLLILDEPMSGLDPLARALVKDALLGAKKEGRTIFLSSHILSDMSEMCDRVSVLSGGNLVFTGSPAALCGAGGSDSIEKAFLSVIGEDAGARNRKNAA